MKLTYSEQLKHPKWQKRRLEILERSDFHCECCNEENVTLHVHHKHYVRGRSVWEYGDGELLALCKDCHEAYHQQQERVYDLLSKIDYPEGLEEIFVLLAAYMHLIRGPAYYHHPKIDLVEELDPRVFKHGKAATIVPWTCLEAARKGKKKTAITINVVNYLGKDTFDQVRKQAKKQEKEQAQAQEKPE